MQLGLTLSGESPPEEMLRNFECVGLVRSEYLFRAAERYPTTHSANEIVKPYLEQLATAYSRPIWYRTLDVTVAEANTLSGVEQIYRSVGYDFMGLRGIRRSRRHPAALQAELEVIGSVRSRHKQIGVVAPFVCTPEELVWFASMVREFAGDDTPLATMIETPSAVLLCEELLASAPIGSVVVGCNDLSSLLNASRRRMGESIPLSESLRRALSMVRRTTRTAGVSMTVAGYLTPDIIRYTEELGSDVTSLHYSDLPKLLGAQWSGLRDLDRVSETKQLTIRRIAEFEAADAGKSAPHAPDI